MIEKKMDYTLYLVTDRRWLGERSLWEGVEEAILGGATIVQLREKEVSSREFLELAQKVKAVTDRYRIPLIVNDRIDIALAAGADGVHVGPEDLTVPVARKLLGKGKIIGASAATVGEALSLQAEGADYLGVGAVFPTATKQATDQVSLEELREIKAALRIPVVAIGGIDVGNAVPVMATGVDGVAVVSAVMARKEIREAARQLFSLVRGAKR
ncbi:MAG: thiamine phosphate synthase [Deltaproteobacteria bacterium]|nr:thiamine phosphate synthase [Deltaproteobacteria bacterium]